MFFEKNEMRDDSSEQLKDNECQLPDGDSDIVNQPPQDSDSADYVELIGDHYVIKKPDGSYPIAARLPQIAAYQKEEDSRHREDISADTSDFGQYRVYASSIRGTGKRSRIRPGVRQDSFAVCCAGEKWIIGVVADGVSASSKSHLLADYMAQYMAKRLSQLLAECNDIESVDWNSESRMAEEAAYIYCRDYCEQHRLSGSYLDYFATTLECIIVGIDGANDGAYAYFSITGDGDCYVFNDKGLIKALKSQEDHENQTDRAHSEAVVALPKDPGDPFIRYGTLNDGEYLLLTTDGYAKIGNEKMKIGEFLFDRLSKVNGIISYLQAMDFLAFQNDDDRTGIMIGRNWNVDRS